MRRSIIDFWRSQTRTAYGWCHEQDASLLATIPHRFNLAFPVSPYVGDVLKARVIILGANAGYDPATTPYEFHGSGKIDAYLSRVAAPDSTNWSDLHQYYDSVNYGDLIANGDAALINCCAYRSPRISKEKDNQGLVGRLPSCVFVRRWLEKAIVPLATTGELLVVAKRYGLWKIAHLRGTTAIVFDPAPVSPHLARSVLAQVTKFLS